MQSINMSDISTKFYSHPLFHHSILHSRINNFQKFLKLIQPSIQTPTLIALSSTIQPRSPNNFLPDLPTHISTQPNPTANPPNNPTHPASPPNKPTHPPNPPNQSTQPTHPPNRPNQPTHSIDPTNPPTLSTQPTHPPYRPNQPTHPIHSTNPPTNPSLRPPSRWCRTRRQAHTCYRASKTCKSCLMTTCSRHRP